MNSWLDRHEPIKLILQPIKVSEIWPEALERFEWYSSRGRTPEEYTPGDFEWAWKTETPLGTWYLVEQSKTYNRWEHCIYIFQYDHAWKALGYAEIWELAMKNQKTTYLYYIGTYSPWWGFASTMIPILGKLSEHFFQKPLNSTRTFCNIVNQRIWEDHPVVKVYKKLVSDWLAKSEQNGSFTFLRRKIAKLVQVKLSSK
jgi:hypothetical protein